MKHSSAFFRSALALLFALGCSGLAAGCGGSTPASDSPAPDKTSSDDTASADGEMAKEFDEMSHDEKMEHMKNVVRPHMAQVFQEWDAEEFAEVECATCHGPGVEQGNYEMPTDSLPRLDQEEMDEHPDVTKFMQERVVPEMAKLLGEEPYDPATGEGFGCLNCHMQR